MINSKGLLITFEGGEGSGKTTQVELVKNYLSELGKDFVFSKEPGGTMLGENLRNILKYADYKICDKAEILLFNSARSELIQEVIKPALADGKIIICDRFYHSNIVYQGYARGGNINYISKICEYACDGIKPDLTIWLDISPKDAFERKGGADKGDRLEETGMIFHQKVYEGYSELANKGEITRIDATQSVEKVFEDIKLKIDNLLKTKQIKVDKA